MYRQKPGRLKSRDQELRNMSVNKETHLSYILYNQGDVSFIQINQEYRTRTRCTHCKQIKYKIQLSCFFVFFNVAVQSFLQFRLFSLLVQMHFLSSAVLRIIKQYICSFGMLSLSTQIVCSTVTDSFKVFQAIVYLKQQI